MSIEKYLREQLDAHPSMQPQDVVKLHLGPNICCLISPGPENSLRKNLRLCQLPTFRFMKISPTILPG